MDDHVGDLVIISDLPRRTKRTFPGGDWLTVERIDRLLPAVGETVYSYFAAVLVLRGEGVYRDRNSDEHRLEPGMVFLRLPGIRHYIARHNPARWQQVVIRASPGIWEALSVFGDPCPSPAVWRAGPGASAALVGLQEVLANRSLPGWVVMARAGEALLTLFPVPADPWERAASALASDHQRRIDLTILASQLGVSYSHFRRKFRQTHGISPDAWRRRARLAEADRLLASGLALRRVVRSTGWSSVAAFVRTRRAMWVV